MLEFRLQLLNTTKKKAKTNAFNSFASMYPQLKYHSQRVRVNTKREWNRAKGLCESSQMLASAVMLTMIAKTDLLVLYQIESNTISYTQRERHTTKIEIKLSGFLCSFLFRWRMEISNRICIYYVMTFFFLRIVYFVQQHKHKHTLIDRHIDKLQRLAVNEHRTQTTDSSNI